MESLICARCGYCRPVCPVYQCIGWESASPRGKLSIARDIYSMNGKGDVTDEYIQRVSQCTLCGACTRACPTDIDIQHYWMELRERMALTGRAPKGYQALRSNLLENRNISTFRNVDRLEWAEDTEDPEKFEPRAGADVCYFVGCVSSFFPQASEISLAVAELFEVADVDVTTLGGEEWCCGFPLLAAGFGEEAAAFMKHNVERLKALGIHTIVFSCPTCHHIWAHDAQAFLEGYDLKVLHITEYMNELMVDGRLELGGSLNATVTYHDPCDLGRNGGVFDAPRQIIKRIPGLRFVEMEHHGESSLCCGGGGNLQSVEPELTEAITAMRVREISDTGASIVVSACQQCVQVLSAGVRNAGLPVRVMDLNQLILEAL
ncbi:(Fe-S)-binding protein [Desulfoluna limicola]|nr:(Fe-S)-binding protein [Desulfoluna limicola]